MSRLGSLVFGKLPLVLVLAALPRFAIADAQAIRQGTELTAAQVGHAFAGGCATSQPLLLEQKLALWTEAFWFSPVEGTDTDFAFVSPERGISVTAEVGALKATCSMTVSTEIGGDGGDIYEGLEAHLAERWWRDSPVETEAVDGGLIWRYTRKGVAHEVRFIESAEGFLISHVAERL